MGQDLVTWLDARPDRYAISASLVVILFVATAFLPIFAPGDGRMTRIFRSQALFLFLLFAALLACRWPVLFFPHELNMDESRMIVQAQRLLTIDPVPWRSVDFGTGGPLLTYVLMLPRLFGFGFDYLSARIVGLLCIWVVSVFTCLTLKAAFGKNVARVAVLPPVLFYCWATHIDLLHYSSEHLPLALLAVAIYLAVRAFSGIERVSLTFFGMGGCLGAVAFSKLQAVPVAAFLFFVVVAAVFRRFGARDRVRPLAGFIAGGTVVPICFIGAVVANSIFVDFWTSFVLISGLYGQAFLPPSQWVEYLVTSSEFFYYFLGVGAFALPVLVFVSGWKRDLFKQYGTTFVLVFGYVLVSAFIVLKPGRMFWHYFHFVVPPLCFVAGFMLHLLLQQWERVEVREAMSKAVSKGILLAFFLITTLPLFSATAGPWLGLMIDKRNPQTHFAVGRARDYFEPKYSSLEKEIAKVTRPGDSMVVWGRYPEYYIRTGLVPSVRYATTGGGLMKNRDDILLPPERYEYYRSRFLADLARGKPPIFIDSVHQGPYFGKPDQQNRELYGFETLPGLSEYIREHYQFWFELGEAGKGIRVYISKERLEAVQPQRVTN